jgi:N-acetylglucosaminyldiphosphoundecaprenol N-acetyl-beta-D-mannosaminyltransferase
MPIVFAAATLAAILWGAVVARRGSLLVGCAVILIVGYVCGYEFWNTHLGPLPLTLDRILVIGLLAASVVQWRMGRLSIRPLTGADLALIALLAVLAISAIFSGQPDAAIGAPSKWGRLLASFLIPAALFFIVRQSNVAQHDVGCLLLALVLLGIYLAMTGALEVAGKWALVFPRYIADPLRGIHFGRARGPELNSVSLGLYLTASFWCTWTLLRQTRRRSLQLLLLAALPLMAGGVCLTYTRSTWLGLAASGLVVAAVEIPRRWRLPALAAAATLGLLLVAASWSQLTGLEREGTAEESNHSIDQRTSFAYVSWQMFRDHPLVGVGFGRFYDRKLPYLSDRSQDFELESIRPLHHHNTLLGALTETGIVGLAAFVAVLAVWARHAWSLAAHSASPAWIRAQGALMLALMANYLCSALFHDLTLIPSQHMLLFAFAGLTVNLRQQSRADKATGWNAPAGCLGPGTKRSNTPIADPGRAAHVPLFGMQISRLTLHEAVERVLTWCGEPHRGICRYVVTPNVDHAVMFRHRADLRQAYDDASLVVADGMPIVLASRLLGRALPERVAGSDLVPRLFETAERPMRVFLLGAGPGVAEEAAARIHRRWPSVQVVGTCSPAVGFETNAAENCRILAAIDAAAPDLVIVGLGAPKQELWVHRHRHELRAKVVLCAGATIDFLAGRRRRSPLWMRHAGLEWLHRLASEPRRLAGRYARDACVFPQLLWREWRAGANCERWNNG